MPQLNPHQIQELRRALIEMLDTAVEDAAQLILKELRANVGGEESRYQMLAKLDALPLVRRVMVIALEEGGPF